MATAAVPDPVESVIAFYHRFGLGDYESAVALWSERLATETQWAPTQLTERTPPGVLTVQRAEVVAIDAAASYAIVAVEVLETDRASGSSRRYVGTWLLVRDPAGWHLDHPDLVIE